MIEGYPFTQPGNYDLARIENGDPKDNYRGQKTQDVLFGVAADHRQGSEHQAQEHASCIPHVYPGRDEVVPDKPQEAAGQGDGHNGNRHPPVEQGNNEKGACCKKGYAGREPVHDIDNVKGIDHPHQPKKGQKNVDVGGEEYQFDKDPGLDQYQDRYELTRELDPWLKKTEVVDKPQKQDDGPCEQQPQYLLVEFKGNGQGKQKGEIDADPAKISNWLFMFFQFAIGPIHNPKLQGCPTYDWGEIKG